MRLPRLVAALLAVVAGAAGCTSTEESAPTPEPTASTSSPTPTTSPRSALPSTPAAGSDGMTIRYRGADGTGKTMRVEDFPR